VVAVVKAEHIESIADIRGSLRWAAGATNARLALHDELNDEFLEAIHWHRLAGRFLSRLALEQSPEVPAELIREVEKQHADARAGVLMRMELVRRLTLEESYNAISGTGWWEGDLAEMRRGREFDFPDEIRDSPLPEKPKRRKRNRGSR